MKRREHDEQEEKKEALIYNKNPPNHLASSVSNSFLMLPNSARIEPHFTKSEPSENHSDSSSLIEIESDSNTESDRSTDSLVLTNPVAETGQTNTTLQTS
jgi:hypothetical protein